MTHAINAQFTVGFKHRLRFTRDAFALDSDVLAAVIREGGHLPARVLAFIDQGLLDHWPTLPEMLRSYARRHGELMTLIEPMERVAGGEACKNDQQLQYRLCKAIHDARLCRQSYVLAIGGGAVLDAVGFASTISHRGVRLIRMPTTTLSQDDSGVGVKNGINAFNKKNYLGAFSVPWAVINDQSFLTTLSDRDFRAGLSEAVKVALIKDAALFERLVAEAPHIAQRDMAVVMPIIERSAQLHLQHITEGGDPFELTTARPLDFGHWAAHKLEAMTYYELRHGEAVAIGIALDVLYSKLIGSLHEDDAQDVLDCLTGLGFELYHDAMRDTKTLLAGLDEFREHLGGQLTVTLLTGIGKATDVHEIDADVVCAAIEQLGAEAHARR